MLVSGFGVCVFDKRSKLNYMSYKSISSEDEKVLFYAGMFKSARTKSLLLIFL